MAFEEGNSHGTTAGTTEVTVVAAPRPLVRRIVKKLTFYNRDGGNVTLSLFLADGATRRQIKRKLLVATEDLELPSGGIYVLDKPTKSLVATLAANPATQTDFTSHYGDSS